MSSSHVRVLGTPVFLFLLALTILKGIRMPNRWAVTHYLFTYETGFMKRGFWGELLRDVLGSWTARYFCLAAVGLLVFAAVILLLVAVSRRVPDEQDRAPLMLVLFASPALSFAAHMVGYLEQVAYLAFLLLLIQRRHWKVQVASAVVAAALVPLVHEASLFWIGALTGLVLVAGPIARQQAPRARFAALALVGGIWVASTLAVSQFGQVSPERAAAVRDAQTAYFDVRPRQDAFATLTVPLEASIADMRVRWADPETRRDMLFSLAIFAPAAIFLGVLAARRARSIDQRRSIQFAALALTVLAIAGPLVLHVVGWDRHRWNALATLNAGLAALTLVAAAQTTRAAATDRDRPVRRAASTSLALVVCLWSVSADPVFFDNYGPAHPPFVYHVQFLIEAMQTGDPNMWIPLPGN